MLDSHTHHVNLEKDLRLKKNAIEMVLTNGSSKARR